jgi:hypothetical protein
VVAVVLLVVAQREPRTEVTGALVEVVFLVELVVLGLLDKVILAVAVHNPLQTMGQAGVAERVQLV